MALDRDPNYVFRDFVTHGIPSSGNWNPRKPEIRDLLNDWWQTLIALVADAGDIDLPNLLIRFEITDGDENDIIATPNLPVPAGVGLALFSIVIEAANSGPVTINSKPLLSNAGNELLPGALVADGVYLFLDNGDSYRLLSDLATSAIAAAAEAAAINAVDAADTAVDAADRAEAAAAGVESPVSYEPQSLTSGQQEQARLNIGITEFGDSFLYPSDMAYNLQGDNGYFIDYDSATARKWVLTQDENLFPLKSTPGVTGAKRDAVYIQHMDHDTTDYYNSGDSFRVYSNGVNIFMSGAYEAGTGWAAQTKDLHGLQVVCMGRIDGWSERGVSGILAGCEQMGDGIASNEFSVRNPPWSAKQSKSMAAVQALVYNQYAASDSTHQAVAVLASVAQDSYAITALFKATTGPEGANVSIDISQTTANSGAIRMPLSGSGRGIIAYDSDDYTNFVAVLNRYDWVVGGDIVMSVNASSLAVGGAADAGARLVLPASTTGLAHIRMTSGAAPSSPQNGDMWFDGALKIRIGGVTRTVSAS